MQTIFLCNTNKFKSHKRGSLRSVTVCTKPFSLFPWRCQVSLPRTHTLSTERLKCHIAGWLDSERPAGRKEMRWKDGLVKLVCSLYCMQAQLSMGSSVLVNLGQLQNHLYLQQFNIALNYLLIWSAALTFLRLSISSFCSHLSLYLSISLTPRTLQEWLVHPLRNVTTLKLSSDVSYC